MLDGENSVSNIVYVATTNYPERLGARIANRPSRFDERILVDMPSTLARRTYLQFAAPGLGTEELEKWVNDTDKFSIAHLRELVAATYCLEQPYDVVLRRLKTMSAKPKFSDGFRKGKAGFTPDEPPSEKESAPEPIEEPKKRSKLRLVEDEPEQIPAPANVPLPIKEKEAAVDSLSEGRFPIPGYIVQTVGRLASWLR